ncbi:hypothetical protein APY04_2105 [Hyphomicrobium sulfonivorans]|uniref:Uncharacterized protein n=1 Tax=Hyphomicrobium sulfonivorans TaxID=121290 RepID=A0A109BE60_HYPSL|nr:hypothetical protein APY04_2105 [Hyphomicrobium sulfonivorans]
MNARMGVRRGPPRRAAGTVGGLASYIPDGCGGRYRSSTLA